MTPDELRAWYFDFEPRMEPGLMVRDPDGSTRPITMVEAANYLHARDIVREDLARAAEISNFLSGANNGT